MKFRNTGGMKLKHRRPKITYLKLIEAVYQAGFSWVRYKFVRGNLLLRKFYVCITFKLTLRAEKFLLNILDRRPDFTTFYLFEFFIYLLKSFPYMVRGEGRGGRGVFRTQLSF